MLPLFGAGLAVAGQAIGAFSQAKTNKKTREWNEKMYGIQRRDALADWEMQNAYNSPAANMERLREAGLNPNLVYGHGTQASNASPMRSTDVKGWNPQAPQFDPGAALGQFQDTQVRAAQIDNLRTQKTLMEQDLKNKIANELQTYAETANKKSTKDLIDTKVQELGMRVSIMPEMNATQLASMRANTEKAIQDTKRSAAETQYRLDENERQQLKTGMTLEQGAVKILQMRKDLVLSSMKGAQDWQLKSKQAAEIDARIERIRADTRQSNERGRILQSQPNWEDQQTIDMLKNLIGGATRSGTMLNPKGYADYGKWTKPYQYKK